MALRTKLAFVCYLLVLLFLGAFGLLYLFSPKFLPYHAMAIGTTWENLAPAYRILILALMKSAGAGFLGSTIAGLFILFIPFRSGSPWARWAILIIGLAVTSPTLYATLTVKWGTPASPPWIAPLIGMFLVFVGFVLSTKRTQVRISGVKELD